MPKNRNHGGSRIGAGAPQKVPRQLLLQIYRRLCAKEEAAILAAALDKNYFEPEADRARFQAILRANPPRRALISRLHDEYERGSADEFLDHLERAGENVEDLQDLVWIWRNLREFREQPERRLQMPIRQLERRAARRTAKILSRICRKDVSTQYVYDIVRKCR